MASLSGKTPQDTFGDLLQVSNSNDGIDATVRDVSDGKGTTGPFQLSTTVIRVGASATLDGASGATLDLSSFTLIGASAAWTKLSESTPTSGSSFQVTGIPSTAVAVMVVFSAMDYSTSTRLRMQVLDSSTVQTSGYFSTAIFYDNTSTTSASTSNSILHMVRINNTDGSSTQSGVGVLSRNGSTGSWTWRCNGRNDNTVSPLQNSASMTTGITPVIAGTMNGLEFETVSGNFSAGTITVYYSEE